jgi:hypothetical protein
MIHMMPMGRTSREIERTISAMGWPESVVE